MKDEGIENDIEMVSLEAMAEFYSKKYTDECSLKLSDKFIQLLKTDGLFYKGKRKEEVAIEDGTTSPTYSDPSSEEQ